MFLDGKMLLMQHRGKSARARLASTPKVDGEMDIRTITQAQIFLPITLNIIRTDLLTLPLAHRCPVPMLDVVLHNRFLMVSSPVPWMHEISLLPEEKR